MPRWPRKPDTDKKIAIATVAFNSGLYMSREACAKAYKINPNIFQRRLARVHQSHKVAHTNQQCISAAGEAAIV
jgi:hypothetical protein